MKEEKSIVHTQEEWQQNIPSIIEKNMPKVTDLMTSNDTTESFKIQKRRLVVVWMYSLKQLKNLKRFGDTIYTSRKMKYVLIYMNEEEIEENMVKIERLHFVRRVEKSYRPDVEMNFADRIGQKDALIYTDDDGFEIEELNTTIKLAEELS